MSVLVSRLMVHYWTADDPPATRQAQMEDWIEDLVDFPIDIVTEACRMWRRANSRRPTPADIIDLCRAELAYRKPPAPTLRLVHDDPDRYAGSEGRCQDRWKSCAERWHTRGFICRASCRERIPDYRTLSDNEAFEMLGNRGSARR